MLTVYATSDHPRLRYTLHVVLGLHLGLSWRLCTDHSAFASESTGPRLQYGGQPVAASVPYLSASGWLQRAGISEQRPAQRGHGTTWQLFPTESAAAALPFDVLAACFYLLSRYEEYLPFEPDAHGRFGADQSIQQQAGALALPMVQHWAQQLGHHLQAHYPQLDLRLPPYRLLLTYDIDMAWAYRLRGWRGLGATVYDALRGSTARTRERLRVWSGRSVDPFFTFDRLQGWHDQYEVRPHYFWLLAQAGRYDRGAPPSHRLMQQLIRRIAQHHPVGIHPSYASSLQPLRLASEIDQLSAITGQPVHRSRQHYLRLRMPDTYRLLLQHGIRQDYTLGFADAPGFRAGTAVPYPWYDLTAEISTTLEIIPFQVMDATLRHYQQLTPAAAIREIEMLHRTVQAYGGTFCTLWHNSSFADTHGWEGWTEVYQRVLASQ